MLRFAENIQRVVEKTDQILPLAHRQVIVHVQTVGFSVYFMVVMYSILPHGRVSRPSSS